MVKKMLAHELPQAVGNVALLTPQDVGFAADKGDGDAVKQGADGKPVGQAAHQRGFGAGF